MGKNMKWLTKHLSSIYEENPYVKLLDMDIVKLEEGYAEINMPILRDKHTNL